MPVSLCTSAFMQCEGISGRRASSCLAVVVAAAPTARAATLGCGWGSAAAGVTGIRRTTESRVWCGSAPLSSQKALWLTACLAPLGVADVAQKRGLAHRWTVVGWLQPGALRPPDVRVDFATVSFSHMDLCNWSSAGGTSMQLHPRAAAAAAAPGVHQAASGEDQSISVGTRRGVPLGYSKAVTCQGVAKVPVS